MTAPAFLLAAGFGTRLRPLTLHRPKPLVPVAGVPMLDYAAALLTRHGIHEAVVNAHHLPEQVVAWAERHPMQLEVSVEQPAILGTGGGLRQARGSLASRFVVVNGDILSDVDLGGLLAGLGEDADAVMALRERAAGERYGIVASDEAGHVVDLVGLSEYPPEGAVDRSAHFTGVHALDQAALDLLPPEGEACIVRQSYVELVRAGRVRARRHRGTWFDVGTPEAYWRANQMTLSGALSLPLNPYTRAGYAHDGQREWGARGAVHLGAGVTLEPPFWLGPGVRISDRCHVGPGSVIGSDAQIGPRARISGGVVWEACQVPAEAAIHGAIVYDGGVLNLHQETRPPAESATPGGVAG
ncbi:MAG: NDP-sugar synthase [Alphaproteobacteria bacterium]|nr:NDP-sugar synthase [Alphaproteobacteria bacterium]